MFYRIFLEMVKKTYHVWGHENISRLSGALAYYTIFTITPLLILCITLGGFLFDRDLVQSQILAEINNMMGQNTANQIKFMIEKSSNYPSSFLMTVVGILILLVGAAGFFSELQNSLNTIWGVQAKVNQGIISTIKNRFVSITIVLGTAFLLLVSLVINTLIAAMSHYLNQFMPTAMTFWMIINFLISFGMITILFALILKILPDVIIKWRYIWSGAIITALLFSVGQLILATYFGKSNISSSYGAAGSFIIILVWVYYSAQILLIGTAFTKVNLLRKGAVIEPSSNAELINKR